MASELKTCCGLLENDRDLLAQFYEELGVMEIWASDTKELLAVEDRIYRAAEQEVAKPRSAHSRTKNMVSEWNLKCGCTIHKYTYI